MCATPVEQIVVLNHEWHIQKLNFIEANAALGCLYTMACSHYKMLFVVFVATVYIYGVML